jgi:uncharacterized membrane protein (UPF0127 family)
VKIALEHVDGRPACERCLLADTFLTRLRGLLGRPALEEGEGLLIRPANSIHTWFMRSVIDAVFLDRDLVVVGVAADVKPWRFAGRRGSKFVLEVAAGESARRGIERGAHLRITPAEPGRGR